MCNYKVSLAVPFLLKGHIFISNLAIYNSDFLPILLYQFGSFHRSQTSVRSRTWQHFPGMTRPCCGTHSISSCLSCFKIAPLPPISLTPLESHLWEEKKARKQARKQARKERIILRAEPWQLHSYRRNTLPKGTLYCKPRQNLISLLGLMLQSMRATD